MAVRRRQRPWKVGFVLLVLGAVVMEEAAGLAHVEQPAPEDLSQSELLQAQDTATPAPTMVTPRFRATVASTAVPTPILIPPQVHNRAESAGSVAGLERQVHVGINLERAKNGVLPLQWEDQLAAVARAHSDDMTSRGYFSHDSPEGLGPSDRIDRAGYSCWKGSHYGVAENIAIETTSGGLDRVAAEAVRGWMNSPGHRTNLLGRQYDRTGVGVSFGGWRGHDAVYLTQVFC